METISLRLELQEALQKDAERESRSINDIVNDVLERYFYERQKSKIAREIDAFEKMHARLKHDYLGKWVAIHELAVVDHDTDHVTLHRRVHAKYGRVAILIRLVKESPEEEDIHLRTWSTGRIEE